MAELLCLIVDDPLQNLLPQANQRFSIILKQYVSIALRLSLLRTEHFLDFPSDALCRVTLSFTILKESLSSVSFPPKYLDPHLRDASYLWLLSEPLDHKRSQRAFRVPATHAVLHHRLNSVLPCQQPNLKFFARGLPRSVVLIFHQKSLAVFIFYIGKVLDIFLDHSVSRD